MRIWTNLKSAWLSEPPGSTAGSTDLLAGALSPATRPVHGISQLTKTKVTLDVHQEEGSSQNQKDRKRKSSNQENLNETKKIKRNNAQDDFNEKTVKVL